MRNWGSCRLVALMCFLALMSGGPAWAQPAAETAAPATAEQPGVEFAGSDLAPSDSLDLVGDLVKPLVLAVVFTTVGLVLFAVSIWLIVKLSPFSIRREIEEDQNVALGIIVGAMVLGMAIILSAAILG
ncbi:MAG: DUF350 domain-containing protein [Planctomycetota bacterium]|nr:DUF350 domain-containing protein [Planctomycetota bacterium]